MTEDTHLPPALAEIVEDFHSVDDRERLELLLEFSRELPELPAKYGENYAASMEQVVECQSPLFLAMEHHEDGTVDLVFAAPAEAPTTRGFASILQQGLSGLRGEEILAVPDDLHQRLGLAKAITPLRLRGMAAMLGRIKRNIRQHLVPVP
ncbi:SufE family protein [Nesterenkonia sphaerica]|uniref:SufE family protein n=1 Tax=Nesterenkonia sphaerica TaxID=1804988 RepID=A0A5R9A3S7_9MICC|nr:SufE family protein [Nesterenkonia sphaerica]MCH7734316.1 SufE family protein [Chloroflexota bacterium]TLP73170.1 SufE family protein [Nesterenkonia sphaerica]